MAKKPEKISVRSHTRTGPNGGEVKVSGYERMKSTPESRGRHPATIKSIMEPIMAGTKIVQRDPERHGTPQPLQGVRIHGRPGITSGVTRVSR